MLIGSGIVRLSGAGSDGRAVRTTQLTSIGHRSRAGSSGQLEVSTLSRPKLQPEIDLIAMTELSESNVLSDNLFDLAALWVNHKFGRCALIHSCNFVNYPAVCLFKASANGFSRTFLFRQSSRRGKID